MSQREDALADGADNPLLADVIEQADTIEAAAVQRSQERLVSLVDAMGAQLKVWQNGMTDLAPKPAEAKINTTATNLPQTD